MALKNNRMLRLLSIGIVISLLIACKTDPKANESGSQDNHQDSELKEAYAVNFNGEKLSKWKEPDSVWVKMENDINTLRTAYLSKTEDPKSYLRYARAYSVSGRVENAIDILSRGIQKFPTVADLYTFRGENMLLGRQLKECVDDFWKAGQNMEKNPGAKGLIQTSVEDSIIGISLAYRNYLNMAIAFMCNNDYSSADKFFEVCGDFSTNSDLWIRSYYWQYACYPRSGRNSDAEAILKNLNEDMQILSISKPYLDAMKYYKGSLSEGDLVDLNFKPQTSEEANPWIVKVYAVGLKNLLNNKKEKAILAFTKIKESGYWNNLISLAAESELMKLAGKTYVEPEKIELNSNKGKLK